MDHKPRDPLDRSRTGRDWESLVERQIREAMEAGAFDELPFRGERLPIEDDQAAGDWAMAHRMLRNAGMLPPWIESDKEARRLLAELEVVIAHASMTPPGLRARERSHLARIVDAANRAIASVNAGAPTVTQHRRPLDAATEAERLERAFDGA